MKKYKANKIIQCSKKKQKIMECLAFKTWEQIQLDIKTYPENVLIYKSGSNYCSYNKSAMRMSGHIQTYPFIIEYLHLSKSQNLVRMTFSVEAFEWLRKYYNIRTLSSEPNEPSRWLMHSNHPPVSDYDYYIWSHLLRLELNISGNVKCRSNLANRELIFL